MFLRDRTLDLGILYSLQRDLERFWQRKTFKWESLLRRQAAIKQAKQQLYLEEEESEDPKEHTLLQAQEEYASLRQNILEQRQEVFNILDFLGINSPKHLAALDFSQTLPESREIEGTIEEVGFLTHYISHLNYPMQTFRYLLRISYEWVASLFRRKT